MNHYFNEAGEPLMTHSQARLEAELDEQSQEEMRLERHHEDTEEEDCDDDDAKEHCDNDSINEDMGYFGYAGMMEE
jgi:hypothetical protein